MSVNSRAETAHPVPGTVAEYEQRRCAICGARYPGFGFGPPLTRRGGELWACAAHRHELEARLRSPSAEQGSDAPQTSLL
jgi:hypothetical protein